MTTKKFNVVTLCGNPEFEEAFIQVERELTLEGYIVINAGHFWGVPSYERELMFMDMCKRKIDMADEVFVVNVDGCINSAVKAEIEYAKKRNKAVNYLVSPTHCL